MRQIDGRQQRVEFLNQRSSGSCIRETRVRLHHDRHGPEPSTGGFAEDTGVHAPDDACFKQRDAHIVEHGSNRLVASDANHVDAFGVFVFHHRFNAVHSAFHTALGEGVDDNARQHLVFFGPFKQGPDNLVDKRFGNHHFTHQKNHLVAPFNAAFGAACIGTNGWQGNPLVNHGQGGKSVVHQAPYKFQIEVINEVVRHDARHHADARKARNDHRVFVFDGRVDAQTGCIHGLG